jgi:serine/threonine protein kinase
LSDIEFGRYKIKKEIGRGGMSIVYRAHDTRTNRDVALKVLPREFLHDPNFRQRFEREAQTIASLEHSAIVPVYDFGEENGQPFLVMRHMTGGSLTDRLMEGPLSLETATAILRRIGSALDYAHQQGLIHRDLKPGNILFDRFGEAYLADFGIVQLTEASSKITGEKALVGTPAYMSPEQAHGTSELDGRSDIYALGIILYEMLTGQLPYHADTPVRLMMKHVLDPLPNIREANPSLPKKVEGIMKRVLSKKPQDRYPDTESLVEDLDALSHEKTKFPSHILQKNRFQFLYGIGVILLSLLCVFGWLTILRLVFLAPDVNLPEIFSLDQWEEFVHSGPAKGLVWLTGGLALIGGGVAFFIWLRRRLPTLPQLETPLFRKWKIRFPVYNPRLARLFLIIGVIGSILFFALAINSCVPEIIRECHSLSPDSPAPWICNLIP